jgi:prepilin-type N-terminal cleavage/methylation domain-containing protein
MQNQMTNKHGFTLVEMLVSIAVFTVVVALAFGTILAATEVRRAASARFDIYRNAQTVLSFMAQELRSAKLYEEDTRFRKPNNPTSLPPDLNEPNNGRGRFSINDWPPPLKDAASMGLSINSAPYKGNGIDDDGDGRTDEEAFNGIDDDGDGEPGSPKHAMSNLKMADGIDNDKDKLGRVDEGIDEDIFYPRDMLNFLTVRDGRDMEVGYALDTVTGRDLWRRAAFFNGAAGLSSRLDGLYPISVLYERQQYPPAPIAYPGQKAMLAPWFDELGSTTNDAGEQPRVAGAVTSNAQGNTPNQAMGITQVYDVMALNILGFDCRAYYYDYQTGELGGNQISSGKSATYHAYSFPAFKWDSSIELGSAGIYGLQILPNEPDDQAYFDTLDPTLTQAKKIALATARTDGLPRIVEITLFVQDQQRLREEPVQVSTRVWLPFGKGEVTHEP